MKPAKTIEITEEDYKGYKLIRTKNGWTIKETGEEFENSAAAKNYINNDFKLTTESQRKAIRKYERNNYRLNIVFPKGTKERIESLHLNKSNSAFIRDTVLAELDRLEKILK